MHERHREAHSAMTKRHMKEIAAMDEAKGAGMGEGGAPSGAGGSAASAEAA